MTHLAERRKKEVVDKAQEKHNIAQQMEKQTYGIERGSIKGARSPSPKIEEETDKKTEQHSENP